MTDNRKPLNEGTTRHIEKGNVKPNTASNTRPTQPPPAPRPQNPQ